MDPGRVFVEKSARLLASDFMPKIERCLVTLSDEDIWWRPNEASNSIGNLLLHLTGNVTQWILGGIACQPFHRNRQQEFDERRPAPARELFAGLQRVVGQAVDIIEKIDPDALLERRQIQDHNVTVLEAIYHVVEHFSMHTGQIILITKTRIDQPLKLWSPRGDP